jgi:cytochrome d ubiquinol oxidase subunit II
MFGWLASVYLTGESTDKESHSLFVKTSRILLILLIISGLGVFFMAEIYNLHFFKKFLQSPVSIACVVIASLTIPLIFRNIYRKNHFRARIWTGVQTACILTGWFAIQLPIMIYIQGNADLSIWNSQAPQKTMTLLVYALITGIFIIFPAFAYLFRVFKWN